MQAQMMIAPKIDNEDSIRSISKDVHSSLSKLDNVGTSLRRHSLVETASEKNLNIRLRRSKTISSIIVSGKVLIVMIIFLKTHQSNGVLQRVHPSIQILLVFLLPQVWDL